MDTQHINARTSAILHEIRNRNPDVIMLQEVTAVSFSILEVLWNPRPSSDRPRYSLHIDPSWPSTLPYFPLLLTRQQLIQDAQTVAYRFPSSRMARGYIAVCGKLSNQASAMFVTSHLESLKDYSAERKDQFFQILDAVRAYVAQGGAGIFAGDTNLRAAEVPASEVASSRGPGSMLNRARQEKFRDAWIEAGSRNEDKFTWDTETNDNLSMQLTFKPKARYDRAFLLPADRVSTSGFVTLGKERLACGVYASDHWGICVDLDFL